MPVRSFECVIERGRLRDADHGFARRVIFERLAGARIDLRADRFPDRLEMLPRVRIAAGRTNQEIAEDLILSIRTVERHITNLYGKIGARGKADATTYALRQGLV